MVIYVPLVENIGRQSGCKANGNWVCYKANSWVIIRQNLKILRVSYIKDQANPCLHLQIFIYKKLEKLENKNPKLKKKKGKTFFLKKLEHHIVLKSGERGEMKSYN
jgi:hypothetical protein